LKVFHLPKNPHAREKKDEYVARAFKSIFDLPLIQHTLGGKRNGFMMKIIGKWMKLFKQAREVRDFLL
jgi:hypothetical protein